MTIIATGRGLKAGLATLRLVGPDWSIRTHFFSPSTKLSSNGDALVALGLLPAMIHGDDLRVSRASPALLASTRSIQAILRVWDPSLKAIRVESHGMPADDLPVIDRRAAFFSAGVDSFFTALTHLSEVDALVFIVGFDAPLTERALLMETRRGAQNAANELGKLFIEVQTDIRRTADYRISWRFYHGAVMATIGHLLGCNFTTFYVPSALSNDSLIPSGSHPALDQLWSSGRVRFIHDGVRPRFEKVKLISSHPSAMRWLRVCNVAGRSAYNCGSCQKCLCTKVALAVAGSDRCESLPGPLDLGRVASLRRPSEEFKAFWKQNLVAAQAVNRADIAGVLQLLLEE